MYPDYADYDYPGEYFYNTDFGDAWRPPMAQSDDERRIEALAQQKVGLPRISAADTEGWRIKHQTNTIAAREVAAEDAEVVGFVAGEFTHRWLTLLRNEWATRPMEAR